MNQSQSGGGRVEPDAVIEANFADHASAQMVALLVAQLRQRITTAARRGQRTRRSGTKRKGSER